MKSERESLYVFYIIPNYDKIETCSSVTKCTDILLGFCNTCLFYIPPLSEFSLYETYSKTSFSKFVSTQKKSYGTHHQICRTN